MSTIEGFHCIQDTSPGPQGVHNRGVPLYTSPLSETSAGHGCMLFPDSQTLENENAFAIITTLQAKSDAISTLEPYREHSEPTFLMFAVSTQTALVQPQVVLYSRVVSLEPSFPASEKKLGRLGSRLGVCSN